MSCVNPNQSPGAGVAAHGRDEGVVAVRRAVARGLRRAQHGRDVGVYSPRGISGRHAGLEVVEHVDLVDVGQLAVGCHRHGGGRARAEHEAGGGVGERQLDRLGRREGTVVDGGDRHGGRGLPRSECHGLIDRGVVARCRGGAAGRPHPHAGVGGRGRRQHDGDGRRLAGGHGQAGCAEDRRHLARGAVDLEREQGVAVPVRARGIPVEAHALVHEDADVTGLRGARDGEVVCAAVGVGDLLHRGPRRLVFGCRRRDLDVVVGGIRGLPRQHDAVHGRGGSQIHLQPCRERHVLVRPVSAGPARGRVAVDRRGCRERAVRVVLGCRSRRRAGERQVAGSRRRRHRREGHHRQGHGERKPREEREGAPAVAETACGGGERGDGGGRHGNSFVAGRASRRGLHRRGGVARPEVLQTPRDDKAGALRKPRSLTDR